MWRIPLRAFFLILLGYLVNHFWQTGWVVGICILSVIDREISWILEEVTNR